eukprot:1154320-Pelagomonas_calceolata.AAC.2
MLDLRIAVCAGTDSTRCTLAQDHIICAGTDSTRCTLAQDHNICAGTDSRPCTQAQGESGTCSKQLHHLRRQQGRGKSGPPGEDVCVSWLPLYICQSRAGRAGLRGGLLTA